MTFNSFRQSLHYATLATFGHCIRITWNPTKNDIPFFIYDWDSSVLESFLLHFHYRLKNYFAISSQWRRNFLLLSGHSYSFLSRKQEKVGTKSVPVIIAFFISKIIRLLVIKLFCVSNWPYKRWLSFSSETIVQARQHSSRIDTQSLTAFKFARLELFF